MEEEARLVLSAALSEDRTRPLNLAESIRRLVEPFGGVELEIAPREPVREPPDFT